MKKRRRKDGDGGDIAGFVDLHFRFGSEMKRLLVHRRRNVQKRHAFGVCERARERSWKLKDCKLRREYGI